MTGSIEVIKEQVILLPRRNATLNLANLNQNFNSKVEKVAEVHFISECTRSNFSQRNYTEEYIIG